MIERILTVGGLTLVSRITGFARDIMLAAILGAGPVADAFFVALRLPNHFRAIFAEGAFNAAFVPAYARIRSTGGAEPARLFADRIFTLLFAVEAVLLVVALAFTPAVIGLLAPGFSHDPGRFALAVDLTRITFPYLLLVSLVTLYGGILNALHRFAAAAAAPILLNLSMMVTLALAVFFPTAGHAAAWGGLLAGCLEVLLVAGDARRNKVLPGFRAIGLDDDVRRFFKALGPATLGSGGTQIALFADTIIASFLAAGALSALYYADRLHQLSIGVIGVAAGAGPARGGGGRWGAGRRGGPPPFAEPRDRVHAAALGAVRGGLSDRARPHHAGAVCARRLHVGRRGGGGRHAGGLRDRAGAVRPDPQRLRDLPRPRRHRAARQGTVRRGGGQCGAQDRPDEGLCAGRARLRDVGRRLDQFRAGRLVRPAGAPDRRRRASQTIGGAARGRRTRARGRAARRRSSARRRAGVGRGAPACGARGYRMRGL